MSGSFIESAAGASCDCACCLCLSPLGGGADDVTQIVDALGTGRTVCLGPGDFLWLSQRLLPSRCKLVTSGPRTRIFYDVGPYGLVFAASPVPSLSVTTTLAQYTAIGDTHIHLVSAAALAVGSRVVVCPTPYLNWIRPEAFEVVAIAGNDITLDVPCNYAWAIGAELLLVPDAVGVRDIELDGCGASILPLVPGHIANRIVELVYAWDCSVQNWKIDASGAGLWGVGCDSAGRRNLVEHCEVRGNGVRPSIGIALEFNRGSKIRECQVDHPAAWGIADLSGTDNLLQGNQVARAILGIAIGSSMLDPTASANSRSIADTCRGCTIGWAIGDGSRGTRIVAPAGLNASQEHIAVGTTIRNNGTCSDTDITGGRLEVGGQGIYVTAGAMVTQMRGSWIKGMSASYATADDSLLVMTDCTYEDNGELIGSGTPMVIATNGGKIVGETCRVVAPGPHVLFGFMANLGSHLELHDCEGFGGANFWGVVAGSSSRVRITGNFEMPGGAAAYATGAADCELWSEREPQLGGGVALITHFAGTVANCNWGIFVSNGGGAVVVPNLLVTVQSGLHWGQIGFAGAPSGAPYEAAARVPNVSLTFKAGAGDLSSYKFRLTE